jgi:hypothetical protein
MQFTKFILDIDYRLCMTELYTNKFRGTKLKKKSIWGYANKLRSNTTTLSAHTGSETLAMSTGFFFYYTVKRPGREADHSSTSNADVKNCAVLSLRHTFTV